MSRTSSAKWKAFRRRMLVRAVRRGELVCIECDRPLVADAPPCTPDSPELDHIIPYAARPDLEYAERNVAWRCHPCNRRKGKKIDPRERMPVTRRW